MLRSKYKKYKDELKLVIHNNSKTELDKEALIIARYSLENSLHMPVKAQPS